MTAALDFNLDVLASLLAQPTAPFHEERVAACVIGYLRQWSVPFFVDDCGNIVARYQRGPQCAPLVLMAHMDHPAFTLVERSDTAAGSWIAELEGGVPAACFAHSSPVRIFPSGGGDAVRGSVTAAAISGDRPGRLLAIDCEQPAAAQALRPGDFGVWDLQDFALVGETIRGRAIDDLCGCGEMLLTLERAVRDALETHLIAVFTRAEEVGLVGGHTVLSSGTLPRDCIVVSLEVSPIRQGVAQGDGPIIRVGDRRTTFTQDGEVLLRKAAERLQAAVVDGPPVKIQRHLMSGGSCEGSVAVLLGYCTTGMTLPLGNYHNIGPDFVLAPESIHVQDFLTGVALLQEAAIAMPEIAKTRAAARAALEPSHEQIARLHMPFYIRGL